MHRETTIDLMRFTIQQTRFPNRRSLVVALSVGVIAASAVLALACTNAEPTPTPAPATPPATATPEPSRPATQDDSQSSTQSLEDLLNEPIQPFTNIAPLVLVDPETGEDLWMIENRHPGVAIFDYDRDGDMDSTSRPQKSMRYYPTPPAVLTVSFEMMEITSTPKSQKMRVSISR